jgi:hypothetical protein
MNADKSTELFDCWAIVELFGHQKIAGRVSEATIAGGAFIRVDVPQCGEQKPFTRFFGPSAIYSINPTTEEIARSAARYHVKAPVERYELPKLAEKNDEPEDDQLQEQFERL